MIENLDEFTFVFYDSLSKVIDLLLLFSLKQESCHLFRLNSHLTKHNKKDLKLVIFNEMNFKLRVNFFQKLVLHH